MTKLLLIVFVLAIVLLVVSYFFGIKPNKKEAIRVFSVSMVLGVICVVGAFFTNHLFTSLVATYLSGLVLILVRIFLIIFSPLFSSLSGVASGKKFKGPYQGMSPEQQESFWNKVRAGAKVATSWYSRYERRRGNHDRANAARWTRKML